MSRTRLVRLARDNAASLCWRAWSYPPLTIHSAQSRLRAASSPVRSPSRWNSSSACSATGNSCCPAPCSWASRATPTLAQARIAGSASAVRGSSSSRCSHCRPGTSRPRNRHHLGRLAANSSAVCGSSVAAWASAAHRSLATLSSWATAACRLAPTRSGAILAASWAKMRACRRRASVSSPAAAACSWAKSRTTSSNRKRYGPAPRTAIRPSATRRSSTGTGSPATGPPPGSLASVSSISASSTDQRLRNTESIRRAYRSGGSSSR